MKNFLQRLAWLGCVLLLFSACTASTTELSPATPELIRVPERVAIDSQLLNHDGPSRPMAGDRAPNFRYTSLYGVEQELADLQGQRVIVNFWATWCLPCLEELPAFVEAIAEYDDVVFLGVNRNETAAAVARFNNELGLELNYITNPTGDIGDGYGVTSIPMTFFVDRNGVISERHIGPLDTAAIHQRLEQTP